MKKLWSFGMTWPADKECGLFGFWMDDFQTFVLQIHVLVRPSCWLWGYEGSTEIKLRALGFGPLFTIHWSDS